MDQGPAPKLLRSVHTLHSGHILSPVVILFKTFKLAILHERRHDGKLPCLNFCKCSWKCTMYFIGPVTVDSQFLYVKSIHCYLNMFAIPCCPAWQIFPDVEFFTIQYLTIVTLNCFVYEAEMSLTQHFLREGAQPCTDRPTMHVVKTQFIFATPIRVLNWADICKESKEVRYFMLWFRCKFTPDLKASSCPIVICISINYRDSKYSFRKNLATVLMGLYHWMD